MVNLLTRKSDGKTIAIDEQEIEQAELDARAKRVMLVNESGNYVSSCASKLTLQMDEAGSGITYIGEAAIGSNTASAVWRIKKLDESGNPELIIKWADGNSNFDNIWDNRTSLTYL